jgi:hypothetical protein
MYNGIQEIDTVDISRNEKHLKSQSMSASVKLLEKGSVMHSVSRTGITNNRKLLY